LRLLRLFAAILLQEKSETLNAGRAITNSKATSEAANRMDGVKTETLKFHTALRTLLSSVPFPISAFQHFSFQLFFPPLLSAFPSRPPSPDSRLPAAIPVCGFAGFRVRYHSPRIPVPRPPSPAGGYSSAFQSHLTPLATSGRGEAEQSKRTFGH
jgi:hypothetical protein